MLWRNTAQRPGSKHSPISHHTRDQQDAFSQPQHTPITHHSCRCGVKGPNEALNALSVSAELANAAVKNEEGKGRAAWLPLPGFSSVFQISATVSTDEQWPQRRPTSHSGTANYRLGGVRTDRTCSSGVIAALFR